MAKLTAEEQELLDKLTKKAEAPDDDRQHVNITIDLSDEKAVRRAMKLGFITAGDLDFDDDGDDDDDDDGDGDGDDGDGDGDGKKRKKKAEPDGAPKRRLSLADRTMGVKE